METFIDASSRSLEAVLLHNQNSFSFILIESSVQMKETHNSRDHSLSAVNYQEHKWLIRGDLKVTEFVLGLHDGYTMYPYFLCLLDSRADDPHYIKTSVKSWFAWCSLSVEPNKILFPPSHNLGVLKNFVNAVNWKGSALLSFRRSSLK